MKRFLSFLIIVTMLAGLVSCMGEDTPVNVDPVDVDATEEPVGIKNIVINELMADNPDFVMGCADDWVELYNGEDEDVSLNSYFLTKKKKADKIISLDGYSIPAKGFLTIKLTDESAFRLSKDGDRLMLVCAEGLVDELEFDASIGRSSYSHEGVCEFATPGYPNTTAGYEDYIKNLVLPELRINEIVSSNSSLCPVDGNYYDMVELYNGSSSDITLSNYWLSDKKTEPSRYRLPDAVLPAGGYYVVCCSGLSMEGHAPFKISSLGETVYLSNSACFVDAVTVPGDVPENESYGRWEKGFLYMDEVTMGEANKEGYSHRPAAPSASVPTGAYDAPFTVELNAEGTVYYTLDGTEPTRDSAVYTEPIPVEGITSIRAFSVQDGHSSPLVSFFYLVDIEHAYPVVNVAIRQEYLTGNTGVLNHIDPEYEHEAYVTMMEDGSECFSAPCGFKLHGNDSKKGAKQNFQLRFRSVYGLSKLEYKVFEDRDYSTFNSLLLKGGSEDYPFCNFRDELCAYLADGATNLYTQAMRPVILYLNGQYWGIYWLRERFDTTYYANRLGVSKSSVNQLKDYGECVVDGTGEDFTALLKYCRTHDLRNESDYQYVMSRIDYVGMMDWYICRSYMADSDLANIRFFNSTEDDGRWHWCFFDLDWSFWINREDPIGATARQDGHHDIIVNLLKNPGFRDLFLKRYAELMSTVLNEESVLAAIDHFVEILEPEIEKDRERWQSSVPLWQGNVEKLRDFVRNGARDLTVLKGIKRYFSLTDAEMISYFGRAG